VHDVRAALAMGLDPDGPRHDPVCAEALPQDGEVVDAVEQRHDDLRLARDALERRRQLRGLDGDDQRAGWRLQRGDGPDALGVLAEGGAVDGHAVAADRVGTGLGGDEGRRDARARELRPDQGADGARAEDGDHVLSSDTSH
jgi:hypothetical protein